jgi:hypothetical protein
MNPISSLLASIRHSSHTADLADKLGEVALDSVLSDGVVKNIPVIGTAITLFRAGNDIAAYFFAKKVIAFLAEVEATSKDERRAFIEDHCNDANGGTDHIGEITLMLLEKIDHPALARLLGRAFTLMIKGATNKQTFELHSYVIKNLNSYLIRQLHQFYGYANVMLIDAPAAVQLANYGLVEVSALPTYSGTTGTMNRSYERTSFGTYFYENIIKYEG